MTEKKTNQINVWMKNVNKDNLEIQDKMAIAGATMEMLQKLEPIYDKYNTNNCDIAKKAGLFSKKKLE